MVHEMVFDYVPFWIQIHCVPLEGLSMESAWRIALKVGQVQCVENPITGNRVVRYFTRVKAREIHVEDSLMH